VLHVVQTMCSKKFHKETLVPSSALKDELDIMVLPDFNADPEMVLMGSKKLRMVPMNLTIRKNLTEFEITRVRVKVAYKFTLQCGELPGEDWTEEFEAVFKGNEATVSVPTEWSAKNDMYTIPQCTWLTKIFGSAR